MTTTDSVLDRYVRPRADTAANGPAEADTTDDLGAFGWLRGVNERAVMLELRRRDGSITALGYAWLERAEFDPSDGILLYFAGKKVQITGRNLNTNSRANVRLFSGIARHRVPWIQEADGAEAMDAPAGATVIDDIRIE